MVAVPALIGLGSSLGDRRVTLALAVQALDSARETTVTGVSRIYGSPPAGGVARSGFLNCAVAVATALGPIALLGLLRSIERRLGRRPAARWADRAIDLDLLLYGSLIRSGRALVLPHPRMRERPFVMVPAAEAAPWMVHPVDGQRLDTPTPVGSGVWPVGVLCGPGEDRSRA